MAENSLVTPMEDNKYIPSDLQATYAEMPLEDRNSFVQIESQWDYNEREFVIKTGTLLRQVQELVRHPGVREGLTFERWYTAHGLKKAVAYRCIAIANGYYRIKAENAPDEDQMLDNFLSLNQKVQEAIGKGKVDPAEEHYLLHTDPSVRESPVWLEMVKEISEGKKVAKQQSDTIDQLKEKNRQLNSKLADSENRRADLTSKIHEINTDRHHLELQLEDERNREPETVVIPPDDYDELAVEIQKSREELDNKELRIQKLQQALKSSPNEHDIRKYKKDIQQLEDQNMALTNQLKELTKQMNAKKEKHNVHKHSYEKVASISSQWLKVVTSELDIKQLIPEVGQLSLNELDQIGLLKIADILSERSKQIRSEILKEECKSPEKVVKADFSDSRGEKRRKRG